MENNRLTKSIFLWDYEDTQSSWFKNVKKIFSKLNFDNEYNLEQIVDIENAKTNLFKLAEHEWKQGVESKLKLRLCKTYMPRYKHALLSQFRT